MPSSALSLPLLPSLCLSDPAVPLRSGGAMPCYKGCDAQLLYTSNQFPYSDMSWLHLACHLIKKIIIWKALN
uniref:Secreted protein n=1 Tax=Oryza punctata TaxID=4537 RepID=A0A0E0KFU8_ORYPU